MALDPGLMQRLACLVCDAGAATHAECHQPPAFGKQELDALVGDGWAVRDV